MGNYDFSAYDELNEILSGNKKPKQEALTVIEDTPLIEGQPEAIKKYNMNESNIGSFSRRNYNDLLDENFQLNDRLKEQADKAISRADQNDDMYLKMLRAKAARVNDPIDAPEVSGSFNAKDFQQNLKKQLDELSSAPKDISQMDQMVATLGPAFLALATGGYAGATAGLDSMKASQSEMERIRKLIGDERKTKIESIGKQIEGTGKLLSAENDRSKNTFDRFKDEEKLKADRLKDLDESLKYYVDKGLISKDKATQIYFDAQKEINNINDKGIQRSVETENKVLDRENDLKKADINAKAAAQRLQDRPPTEGMINSASAFASMTKAQQAFDRMIKDTKTPPSMSSKFFDTQKSLFENAKPGVLMGDLLKQVPDANIRRQIQIELDFLAPKLRKESGAAISPTEWMSEASRYFPRKGDDAKTIAEKDASKKQAVENFRVGAGKAPIPVIQQPDFKSQELSRQQKIQRLKQLEGK